VSTAATRHGGKSAAAFRTISEVSDDLDVPQHVLRFWETKFTQVRPLKRGGGRRYYRPDDIELLRRIRNLLYSDGYTIKGVQKLLREGGGRREQAAAAAQASAAATGAAGAAELGAAPPRGEAPPAREASRPSEGASAPGTAPGTTAGTVLPAPRRAELEALLRELVDLRDLLRAAAK
jgi:DNA-binding transcriptional MerR regulator